MEAVKIDITKYITNYEYMIHFMRKYRKTKIFINPYKNTLTK